MEVNCVVLCKLRRGGGGVGKPARAAGRGGGAEEIEGAVLFGGWGQLREFHDRRALALFYDRQLEGVGEDIGDG
jgi:hypothetical protein